MDLRKIITKTTNQLILNDSYHQHIIYTQNLHIVLRIMLIIIYIIARNCKEITEIPGDFPAA